jgi:uncharacterized membrane protein YczE
VDGNTACGNTMTTPKLNRKFFWATATCMALVLAGAGWLLGAPLHICTLLFLFEMGFAFATEDTARSGENKL